MTGAKFSWATLIASLAVGLKMPIHEIGKLTPYQLEAVYNHPRDQKGMLVPPTEYGQAPTFQEQFRHNLFEWGLPDWRIDERWREHLTKTRK